MSLLTTGLKDLYEKDYYSWAMENARLLEEGRVSEIDLENLAGEVESLGKREFRELENRLEIVLDHLTKLHCSKSEVRDRNERGWRLTLKEQRMQIEKILGDSPGLVSKLPVAREEAWKSVSRLFSDRLSPEERARPLPPECPWTQEQTLDPEFFPLSERAPSRRPSRSHDGLSPAKPRTREPIPHH